MSSSKCVFCQVIGGDLDAAVVFEDPDSLAFLDHRPLFPGHVLLVPRSHYATLPELPEDAVEALFLNVRRLARAVQAAMEAQGTFVALNNTVSQSVPHLHVHIVPRTKGDGLRGFFWPRTRYDGPEHVAAVRDRIRDALAATPGAS